MGCGRGVDGEGDDEGLDVATGEGFGYGGRSGVVDLSNVDAWWDGRVGGAPTGESSEGVLSCAEESEGDVPAYAAACLLLRVRCGLVRFLVLQMVKWNCCLMGHGWVGLTPTMATRSMRLVKPAGWSLAYS